MNAHEGSAILHGLKKEARAYPIIGIFNRKIIAFFDDRESRKTVPNFSRFLKLYWTELITSEAKFIVDPVRIEFFQGPRAYDIFARVTPPVVLSGVERTIATQQRLEVAGNRSYIELIARTDESVGRQYCEDQIDRVVTQLSALLSPSLFAQEVWSGWLSDPEHLISEFWLMRAPLVNFESDQLKKQLVAFRGAVANDPDIEQRFTLMSSSLQELWR
jgi:hypothetical protein